MIKKEGNRSTHLLCEEISNNYPYSLIIHIKQEEKVLLKPSTLLTLAVRVIEMTVFIAVKTAATTLTIIAAAEDKSSLLI